MRVGHSCFSFSDKTVTWKLLSLEGEKNIILIPVYITAIITFITQCNIVYYIRVRYTLFHKGYRKMCSLK